MTGKCKCKIVWHSHDPEIVHCHLHQEAEAMTVCIGKLLQIVERRGSALAQHERMDVEYAAAVLAVALEER